MIKMNGKKAASIVEVVVATSILMVTILAVFATIAKTRAPVAQSDAKLQAAIYGKKVLDALRAEISSDGWTTSPNLTAGAAHNAKDILNVPSFNTSTYTITDETISGELVGKKATVNVVYTP